VYWSWGRALSATASALSAEVLQGKVSHDSGKPRQAMMSITKIQSANEINHEDYDVLLSLFDTGADGNLRTNKKDLENNAPINHVDIITAGNGNMTSTIVKIQKGNLHHFWREGMYVEGVNQNISSHLDFTQSGHLVFFHKNKAGIIQMMLNL